MKRLSFSDPMMRAIEAETKTCTRRPHVRQMFEVGEIVAATCAYHVDDGITYYRFRVTSKRLYYTPARFMPAALAPFRLKITGVSYERLQAISDDSAFVEGFPFVFCGNPETNLTPAMNFKRYWDSLYAKNDALRWAANPMVFAYGFEVEN